MSLSYMWLLIALLTAPLPEEQRTVVQSPAEIAELHTAAKKGDPQAQYELGFSYLFGLGVSKSEALAVAWWQRAADSGHASAQNLLGAAFADGAFGVVRDDEQAISWYQKAAAQGEPAGTSVGGGGGVNVGMRCRDCSHEWRFDLPATMKLMEPIFGEKPDGRGSD